MSDIYLYGFILAVALVVAPVPAAVPDQVRPQRAGHHAGPRPRPGSSASTVNRVAALTFGIGVAVTAAGGMVYGATSGGFNPNSGYDLISRLLAIIILGGLGSIGGALVARRLHDHAGVAGGHLVTELGHRGLLRSRW